MDKYKIYAIVLASMIGGIVGFLSAFLINLFGLISLYFVIAGSLIGFFVGIIMSRVLDNNYTKVQIPSESTIVFPERKPLPAPITSMFLFNTLHCLSTFSILKPEQAEKSALDLANLIRVVDQLSKNKRTLLAEELRAIELYIALEQARLGSRLQFVKKNINDCFEVWIPGLLLFPLIENCIHYGVELQENPVNISISCHLNENDVSIEIADFVSKNGDTVSEDISLARQEAYLLVVDRLIKAYGNKVKIEREILEPCGERIKIMLPKKEAQKPLKN